MKNKLTRKIKRSLLRLFKMLFVILFAFVVALYAIVQPLNEVLEGHSEKLHQENNQEEFLQEITPYAQEVSISHGVRPSLLVAQAALESNWGESDLAKEANNYFGIKNKQGKEYATKEFTHSEWIEVNAVFKQYDSIYDSVLDYANLLKNGTSWNENLYTEVLEAPTYQEAAYALTEAGYATDPTYAKKLIQIIEIYDLQTLDNG